MLKRTDLEVKPILAPDDTITVTFNLDAHNDTDEPYRVVGIEWVLLTEKVVTDGS